MPQLKSIIIKSILAATDPMICGASINEHCSDYYSTWVYSLLESAVKLVTNPRPITLAVATTSINIIILIGVIFLWLVNRQFHVSRKKHSYDSEPSATLINARKSFKKITSSIRLINNDNSILDQGEGVDQELRRLAEEEEARENAERKYEASFHSYLDGVDEEEDEDDEDNALPSSSAFKMDKSSGIGNEEKQGDDDGAKKKRAKDLIHLASNIEIFSYLSPDALLDVLDFVEYEDYKNVGDSIWDADTLDGSIYAVITGQVTTSLSFQNKSHNPFSFVSGSGEIITSLLSIITSLVREYELRDTLLNPLTLLGGRFTNTKQRIIPHGLNVHAVTSASNTRLLRIPSRCFVTILEKYPQDVHNICQTIMARLQRVTIQTLIRFLGLEAKILGLEASNMSFTSTGAIPKKEPRYTTDEWGKLDQALVGGSRVDILKRATLAAASLMGLSADNYAELTEGAEIVEITPGSIICSKGQLPDAIYLILNGFVEVGMDKRINSPEEEPSRTDSFKRATRTRSSSSNLTLAENSSAFEPLYTASSGNWIGVLSCFTNDASIITVRCLADTNHGAMLLKIPLSTFQSLISRYPRALIRCLHDLIETIGDGSNLCVSPVMFLLDTGLDWMHCQAGEYIAIENEPCDSIYVVLNGRLRAESAHKIQSTRNEFGRGATIGEMEALAERRWSQSVYAIRHVEVARIPIQLINIIMEVFPTAAIHLSKVVAENGLNRQSMAEAPSLLPSYHLSLATIAVVPLTDAVDVSDFCSHLMESLALIAPAKLLTKKATKERVGTHLFQRRNTILKVKMTRVLGDVEESNRVVVYQADYNYTWWTKLAIQQADCVLILVDSSPPDRKRTEECLAWANKAKNVRVEMVVQSQSNGNEDSSNEELNRWSDRRQWISKIHIVRCSFKDYPLDFHRMTRRITGQAVGLVLGGGGARGLSHLGVIRAFHEVGVPIDIVGGTSQGAYIGGLLARYPDDIDQLYKAAREMSHDMSSVSNKLRDMTFPVTSYFSGYYFNRCIKESFGNLHIQDFLLQFFCVSVDMVGCEQIVHTKGLAWKYVRASMTLVGYLPPISENNRLLVDGGYMNVLPADVMSEMKAKHVIAVHVGKERAKEYYEYGTELSGLWLLYNSWNPFVQTVKVPSMGDISRSLAFVSSERTMESVIQNNVDLFLRPPVSHFATLDYDKFDEIERAGFAHAKPLIEEWARENHFGKYRRE